MNSNIEKLYAISQKESRLILGLMSGTSLDGLDLALCLVKGNGVHTNLRVLRFETIPFTPNFRADIQRIFAQEHVSLKMLCAMNAKIAITHAQIINETLNRWQISPGEIDLIASHGQTVYHAPNTIMKEVKYPNSTLQIGDGDHIAVLTGIITVSDFRQKHVAAGGEGAPLVVYGDYLLFSHPQENRIMLNIGGISNLTFLPATRSPTALQSTDVGPGNTLLNQYMKAHFNLPHDQDGQLAAKGTINTALLKTLITHPFFEKAIPKTTGPEEFHLGFVLDAKKTSNTEHISHEDCLATLVAFTIYGISKAIQEIPSKNPPPVIYLSGGGIYNLSLVQKLKDELSDYVICSTSVLKMSPDAKEAALFALLANETLVGTPLHFPKSTGVPAVSMGKISFPS